jgi:hypothetical protein
MGGQVLDALNGRLRQQGDWDDQDSEEEQGAEDRGQRSASTEEALELAVSGKDGDCNDDAPGDERKEWAQDEDAEGCEESEKTDVDRDFKCATYVVLRGRLGEHGYVLLERFGLDLDC